MLRSRVFWFEAIALLALIAFIFFCVKSYVDVKPKHAELTTNHLSWQSATWAVATIALSTMADLPSELDGYPKELAFYLKANPLTCLANVLTTVLILTPSGVSTVDHSLMHLATLKFGDRGLEHLNHRPIRITLFIFGSVPQAIKLYACRGVMFTQVIASCYLLDFVNDELILLYAQRRMLHAQRRSPRQHSVLNRPTVNNGRVHSRHPGFSKDEWVGFTYYTNIMWSATWLALIALLEIDAHKTFWAMVAICVIFSLVFVFYGLSTSIHGPSERLKHECYLLSSPMVAAMSSMPYFVLALWTDSVWLPATLVLFPLMLLAVLVIIYMNHDIGKRQADFPKFAYIFLAVFSLVAYYATIYDATQTSRPDWVEWLG